MDIVESFLKLEEGRTEAEAEAEGAEAGGLGGWGRVGNVDPPAQVSQCQPKGSSHADVQRLPSFESLTIAPSGLRGL